LILASLSTISMSHMQDVILEKTLILASLSTISMSHMQTFCLILIESIE